MKKGIFARRQINSNLRINELETKREDLGEKLSLSAKRPPWHKHNRNLCAVKSDANNDFLSVQKMPNEDNDGMEYFLELNDDHERLIEQMDCVPNELAIFIDNEIKIAEDTNTLVLRELWENLKGSKDDVALVRLNIFLSAANVAVNFVV